MRSAEWKQGLEDWNVRQSQVANEWRAEIRRDDVLQALELRHGVVPSDLEMTVQQMLDLQELKRWHEAAILAQSLDEFRRRVQANGHPEPPAEAPPTNGR
jgi:polyhydroxyalkanoate synthesis regulator phasin